jgi:TPR repeat protein
MKRAILLAVLLCSLSLTAGAQDFKKGADAYKRGDYATALREWRPLAEQGDADAQARLGFLYYQRLGVPQDVAEAAKWFRKAAEQGLACAQYNLGVIEQLC